MAIGNKISDLTLSTTLSGSFIEVEIGGTSKKFDSSDLPRLSTANTFAANGIFAAGLQVRGGPGANSLVLDKTGSAVARFRLFVGDGTGGSTADQNYISCLNTGLHVWAGASGNIEVFSIDLAGTNTVTTADNVIGTKWLGATGQLQVFAYDPGSTGTLIRALNAAGAAAQPLTLSGSQITTVGKVIAQAGTTSAASVNIPHGAAPSSPVNGDMWTTTAGLFVRINGATVGPLT